MPLKVDNWFIWDLVLSGNTKLRQLDNRLNKLSKAYSFNLL